MDWDEHGLLAGLEGAAREARRRLLDELHDDGVSVEDLRAAVEEDRLVLLPVERTLLGAPGYTARDVAERVGIDLELFLEVRRALGLSPAEPDAVAYTHADVEAAARAKAYVDAGLPQDEWLGLLRVIGHHMGQIAEAMRDIFARTYLRAGDSERTLSRRYAQMAEVLLPLAAPDLEYVLRLQLRELTRHDAIGLDERRAGQLDATQEVAVAFADIVGFTALGEELPAEELGEIASHLTDLVREHVHAPVRLVKTIGDAVMLVSPEPGDMVDTVLSLLEAVDADPELPPVRAGVAYGPALARFSDWYGGTVNLASRITTRARSGSVLTSDVVHDALDGTVEGLTWSFAGEKRLKGMSTAVSVWRVRRAKVDTRLIDN